MTCSATARLAAALVILWMVQPALPTTAQDNMQASESELDVADTLAKAGNYGAAYEQYKALFNREDDNARQPVVVLRLAEMANKTGRPSEALDVVLPFLSKLGDSSGSAALYGLEIAVDASSALERYDEAIAYAEQRMDLIERNSGKANFDYAGALLTKAVLLERAQRRLEAGQTRREALALVRPVDREGYRRLANQFGNILVNNGFVDSASQAFAELIADYETEPDDYSLGIILFNTAILERQRQDWDRAVDYHERAIALLTKTTGENSADTISAIGGLGQTYSVAGRPTAALPLLEKSYRSAVDELGASDADTMIQGNNLAEVYRQIGQADKALPIDKGNLDTRRRTFGPTDQDTLVSWKNYALDLLMIGLKAESIQQYDALIAVMTQAFGEDGQQTRAMIERRNRLAAVSGVEPNAALASDVLADSAPATGMNVIIANQQAGIAEQRGDAREELRLTRLAYRLSRSVFGPIHQTSIKMLTNLARVERQQKDPAASRRYRQLETDLNAWAQREFASSSDARLLNEIAETTRATLGDIVTFAYRGGQEGRPDDSSVLASVLLDWKSPRSLERLVIDAAQQNASSDDKALIDEVQTLRRKSLQGDSSAAERDSLAKAEARLAGRFNELKHLSTFKRRDYSDIVRHMGPDAAIADFIVVPVKMDDGDWHDRIFAMLSLSDSQVYIYDLGDTDEIARLLEPPADPSSRETRSALYKTLFSRIDEKLERKQTVFVAPDGILNLVPFDSLLDGDRRPLFERLDIRIVGNAASIPVEEKRDLSAGSARQALVVGDVDFSGDSPFAPLPGTKIEADDVRSTLSKMGVETTRLSGDSATEEAVRADSAGRQIIHFATHGYFRPVSKTESHPLRFAGIALADANHADTDSGPTDPDDGLLTASELATFPLSGAELVTLSACQTASGDISYVDGLAGMPSALAAAGVKRSLLARWSVSDAGAQRFMAAFYRNLADGISYEKAFRQTKIDTANGVIQGVDEATAAAFVLINN
ncbi:CHAT domain-containing protein [Agrobacterium sp. ES01]|uniref:CHAT domain-containing protein n=1 Tax=Agrobacterium sp. ES01 TaxID=3420714 RepID=UPI003D0E40C2